VREIKFRAWVTDQEEPFMAIQGEPDLETLGSFMHHYADEDNLMQFTGVYDRNGKEIYEGDIVEAFKHGDEEQRFELTVTHHHCFMFGSWAIVEFLNKFRMISVVGNTYENEGLLNG